MSLDLDSEEEWSPGPCCRAGLHLLPRMDHCCRNWTPRRWCEPTILPSLPRALKAGIFFAFSLPEATTEMAAGVFTDAYPRGVSGLVAPVITYSFPRTTEAVAAIDACSFPRTAAVVTALVPGVTGSGPLGFRDVYPGVFPDGCPGVAGMRASDFTEAHVVTALAAVAPHSHLWTALPVAILFPNSLQRDAAVLPLVFTGSSRVPSGKAAVLTYSYRTDRGEAVPSF